MSESAWFITNASLAAPFDELPTLFHSIEPGRQRGQLRFIEDLDGNAILAWLDNGVDLGPDVTVPPGGCVLAMTGRGLNPFHLAALVLVAPEGGRFVHEDGTEEWIEPAQEVARLREMIAAVRRRDVPRVIQLLNTSPPYHEGRLPTRALQALAETTDDPALAAFRDYDPVAEEEAAISAAERAAAAVAPPPVAQPDDAELLRSLPTSVHDVERAVAAALAGDRDVDILVRTWGYYLAAAEGTQTEPIKTMISDALFRLFETASDVHRINHFSVWFAYLRPVAYRARIAALAETDDRYCEALDEIDTARAPKALSR